jgi:hypothetical protein
VSVVCPVTPTVPATPRVYAGDVDPIPTLPLDATLNHCAPVEEAIVKRLLRDPAVPVSERRDDGVVDTYVSVLEDSKE